jgi:hypothetical protein
MIRFFDDKPEDRVVTVFLPADKTTDQLVEEVSNLIGKPHNYGPKPEEILAMQKLKEEEEVFLFCMAN